MRQVNDSSTFYIQKRYYYHTKGTTDVFLDGFITQEKSYKGGGA